MQRPRSIILLIVWFLWATGKDLDGLARFATTADYYVFSSIGATWIYFVLAGAVFLLNAASVFYLFRPHPAGYCVLLAALGAGVAQNLVTTAMAVRDIPGVREAYEIGRELRGLAVRREAMDMIFKPSALWLSAGLSVLVYAAIAFLVRRNRSNFMGPAAYAAEA
ncbi:hypothetical protein [Luteimonas sp. MC1828]|uniref:hypothetical protein n=1 Tax=Luteimonas sp. MC1828 TaxID=2799787 RepID=UPI0018F19009|nr:hypothetical protein [Luteimonas sp. MC1828]MBJ7575483.1 hypothetical protein [Luteimonas sp. MC1828]